MQLYYNSFSLQGKRKLIQLFIFSFFFPSLIQNCKSNFNIGMKEDEAKNFLKPATLDQV